MEQEGQQVKGLSTDTAGPVDQVPVRKKRKRLPSLERLRHELVYQLRESIRASQEKMNNPELSLAERHHWTQVHTYTAQVLNTILRDLQLKDWEKRKLRAWTVSHGELSLELYPGIPASPQGNKSLNILECSNHEYAGELILWA